MPPFDIPVACTRRRSTGVRNAKSAITARVKPTSSVFWSRASPQQLPPFQVSRPSREPVPAG